MRERALPVPWSFNGGGCGVVVNGRISEKMSEKTLYRADRYIT